MERLSSLIQTLGSPRELLGFVTELLLSHGYLVVFLGSYLDSFGLPASSEVVMFAGGWLANVTTRIEVLPVMFAGFAGTLLADHTVYWIGRTGGRPLVNTMSKMRFISRLLNEKQMSRAERYFAKHGGKTIFLGRFAPGIRTATPLFAGVSRMSYLQFAPYSLLATILWAIANTAAGYLFGRYWGELLEISKSVGYVFLALLVALIAFYVYRRRKAGD